MRIETILHDFRGLKYIKAQKSNSKKQMIAAMRNSEGTVVTSQADIANVLADFYKELYSADGLDTSWTCLRASSADMKAFDPFTASELSGHVRKMANGKASDECGLSAELLKACGGEAMGVTAKIFSDVMDPRPKSGGRRR